MYSLSFLDEPEREIPQRICLDCRWTWIPEDGTWEPDDEGGEVFMPYEKECPKCGSDETDED